MSWKAQWRWGGGGREAGETVPPYASDKGLFQAQRVRFLRCFGLEKGLDYDQCNLKRGYVSKKLLERTVWLDVFMKTLLTAVCLAWKWALLFRFCLIAPYQVYTLLYCQQPLMEKVVETPDTGVENGIFWPELRSWFEEMACAWTPLSRNNCEKFFALTVCQYFVHVHARTGRNRL